MNALSKLDDIMMSKLNDVKQRFMEKLVETSDAWSGNLKRKQLIMHEDVIQHLRNVTEIYVECVDEVTKHYELCVTSNPVAALWYRYTWKKLMSDKMDYLTQMYIQCLNDTRMWAKYAVIGLLNNYSVNELEDLNVQRKLFGLF